MKNLPVTAAINMIKAVKDNYNVELQSHSPCGTKGFFLTLDEANPEITDFIVNAFRELNASVEVSEDQKLFMHRWS
jgi:hypothetical protein